MVPSLNQESQYSKTDNDLPDLYGNTPKPTLKTSDTPDPRDPKSQKSNPRESPNLKIHEYQTPILKPEQS